MPIKTSDQILGPALDKMYELRPSSFKHLNLRSGVYWHPFSAFRSQAAVALRYAVGLLQKNRLTCKGQDLRDYVASEFIDPPINAASFGLGAMVLSRPSAPVLPTGTIPKGTKYTRKANQATQIPLASADYTLLGNVHFDVGQLVSAPVLIQSSVASDVGNHPIRTDNVPSGVTYAGPQIFDPAIVVQSFSCAGGSLGTDDEFIRSFAKAFARGQYGPNADESRYGVVQFPGVRNYLVYDDVANGAQRVLVADSKWASSEQFSAAVQQSLFDLDMIGFGMRVDVAGVRNKVISVKTKIVLRDSNLATNTLPVDLAIAQAVRDYFDLRRDWHIWKSRGLRNAITRSHPAILHCSEVKVYDVDGVELTEIASADYTVEQFHYYLADNAVTNTYSGPV